jgi:hypothetical protein
MSSEFQLPDADIPASKRSMSAPVPMLAWLEDTPPIAIAGVAVLIGVLLMFGSLVAGVNSFSYPGNSFSHSKVYGYWYAVNWSLNYVLVIPIAIYCAANTFDCIRELISTLVASGMIIRPESSLTDRETIDNWHDFGRTPLIFALVLSGIAFVASWSEYYYSCFILGRHLADLGKLGGPILSWAVAPYFNGGSIVGARVFGFIAFTAEGCVASVFIIFVAIMLAFSSWIFHFTSNGVAEELVPDLKSTDPGHRNGFERFEPLVVNLLFALLFFFGVFFLTRLDSAFVRSPHADIFDFAAKDLGQGFISRNTNEKIPHGPMELADEEVGYSIMAVGSAMGITLFMAFLVPSFILWRSAQISCSRASANLSRLQLPQRTGLTADEIRSKLKEMTFWPLKYPRPAELTLFLLLGGACFIYYNLTLFLIGACIARATLLFLGIAVSEKR